jgi:hypothetical protein
MRTSTRWNREDQVSMPVKALPPKVSHQLWACKKMHEARMFESGQCELLDSQVTSCGRGGPQEGCGLCPGTLAHQKTPS